MCLQLKTGSMSTDVSAHGCQLSSRGDTETASTQRAVTTNCTGITTQSMLASIKPSAQWLLQCCVKSMQSERRRSLLLHSQAMSIKKVKINAETRLLDRSTCLRSSTLYDTDMQQLSTSTIRTGTWPFAATMNHTTCTVWTRTHLLVHVCMQGLRHSVQLLTFYLQNDDQFNKIHCTK